MWKETKSPGFYFQLWANISLITIDFGHSEVIVPKHGFFNHLEYGTTTTLNSSTLK